MAKKVNAIEIDVPKKEIEAIDKELQAVALTAPVKIATQDQYEQVVQQLKDNKVFLKRIDDVFDPLLKAAKPTLDAIKKEKEKHSGPVKAFDDRLRSLSSAWMAYLEDKRQKEQEKLDRKNEAARLKLEAKNEKREAEGKAPLEVAAPVLVAKEVDTAGLSYRTDWRYRIIDESKVPRKYWVIDEKLLAADVRVLKGSEEIPGIEQYAEKTPVVR